MNLVWSYVAVGALTVAAAAVVAAGEPAIAELRLAEVATVAAGAGVSVVTLLAEAGDESAGKVLPSASLTPRIEVPVD